MCTVTFYKDNKHTIFTSNRDEHYSRPNALPPKVYSAEKCQLIYCKDPQANGTWMSLRNDGTVIILLNGAFERHKIKPPYKKSRGLVLLDIINEENSLQKLNQYDLTNIEPFTIVLYSNSFLYECIWDGNKKYIEEKSIEEKYIWSSVTLYDTEFRIKKQELFLQLINSKDELTKEDILTFHHSTADAENGFIINRNNQLITFSVTQIEIKSSEYIFYHHDIKNDKEYTEIMYANL